MRSTLEDARAERAQVSSIYFMSKHAVTAPDLKMNATVDLSLAGLGWMLEGWLGG